jgi:hypothetical protein
MNKKSDHTAEVEPVGARERVTLELRGRVLICHVKAWAHSFSTFIPTECISITMSRRRDGRRLIRALLAPLIGMFLLGAIGVILGLNEEANTPQQLAAAAVIGLLFIAICGYTLYGLFRFLRRVPTTRLDIRGRDAAGALEFWHRPGDQPPLDHLVKRLIELEREVGEEFAPVQVGYTWQHVRPIRAVLISALSTTILLYLLSIGVVQIWQWVADVKINVEPAYFLILLLPWLWFGGMYLVDRFHLRREPGRFQDGLRAYNRERFRTAETAFRDTLEHHPQHIPSLYLLVQLNARRYDFDQAFQYCNQLSAIAPDEAAALQEDLWVLKRMRARMED